MGGSLAGMYTTSTLFQVTDLSLHAMALWRHCSLSTACQTVGRVHTWVKQRGLQCSRGLVFVATRKAAETAAAALRQLGYKATPYHSGMTAANKASVMSEWQAGDGCMRQSSKALVWGECQMCCISCRSKPTTFSAYIVGCRCAGVINQVVTTSSLAVGGDVCDVRFIVHLGLPPTLIDYVQDVGRGGECLFDAACSVMPPVSLLCTLHNVDVLLVDFVMLLSQGATRSLRSALRFMT